MAKGGRRSGLSSKGGKGYSEWCGIWKLPFRNGKNSVVVGKIGSRCPRCDKREGYASHSIVPHLSALVSAAVILWQGLDLNSIEPLLAFLLMPIPFPMPLQGSLNAGSTLAETTCSGGT